MLEGYGQHCPVRWTSILRGLYGKSPTFSDAFVLCILKAVKKLGHQSLRDAMVWPTNFATYESFWLHNPILMSPTNNWNTAGIYRLWKFSNGKWVPMLG